MRQKMGALLWSSRLFVFFHHQSKLTDEYFESSSVFRARDAWKLSEFNSVW